MRRYYGIGISDIICQYAITIPYVNDVLSGHGYTYLASLAREVTDSICGGSYPLPFLVGCPRVINRQPALLLC